jgi:hypothetical protein
MTDLSAGDFLYQSDQELFLVVTGETEDSYTFAAHGWREIGKDRIDEYINDTRSKVHQQGEIEQLIDENGDQSVEEQFNKLKQLFSVYETANIPDAGPHSEFSLEEQ